MTNTINIGGKDIEMTANAATPYRYTQLFHEDFFARISDTVTDASATDLFTKLAFVMASQAAKADFTKLTIDSFYVWLEQFNANDLIEKLDEISGVYSGTSETVADPK